jgi:hypothetical protein
MYLLGKQPPSTLQHMYMGRNPETWSDIMPDCLDYRLYPRPRRYNPPHMQILRDPRYIAGAGVGGFYSEGSGNMGTRAHTGFFIIRLIRLHLDIVGPRSYWTGKYRARGGGGWNDPGLHAVNWAIWKIVRYRPGEYMPRNHNRWVADFSTTHRLSLAPQITQIEFDLALLAE